MEERRFTRSLGLLLGALMTCGLVLNALAF